MVEGNKDYVQNVERKDNLQPWVEKDKIQGDFNFEQFDQKIENSFQQFLESNKNQMTESTTLENVKAMFNSWLDSQMETLDQFKNDEVAKLIIKPTSFELQKFKSVNELGILEKEIQEQKDRSKTEETVSIEWKNLKIGHV